ncbi:MULTISPECIES: hypothetical protein [unclassified Mesorhizobium]|nr:hypothetical protein [Mesorhizobium sp. LSJC255A00]ESX21005.1 hypothetical protein X766_06180 [Mesorhizobium sp. LSJC255A00]
MSEISVKRKAFVAQLLGLGTVGVSLSANALLQGVDLILRG